MKDEMVAYYRARAPEYEKIYFREDAERRRELADEAGRLEQIVANRSVLELACGTGYWTEVMSRTAKEIIAADIAPEMLTEAKRKSLGCPVQFVFGDLHEMPFISQAFDLVALGFWFSHHPRQKYDQLFQIITQFLKSDKAQSGQVWFIDNNPPAEGPQNDSVRIDEHGNNFKRRYLENGDEHIILKNYFSESQLTAIFKPYFGIDRLTFGRHYWAVLLTPLR